MSPTDQPPTAAPDPAPRDAPGPGLFDALAEQLTGAVSPEELQQASDHLLQHMAASRLTIWLADLRSAQISRLADCASGNMRIYRQARDRKADARSMPPLLAELAEAPTAHHLSHCDPLLFDGEAGPALVLSIALPDENRHGLLAFAAPSREFDNEQQDACEMLLAALLRHLRREDARARVDDLSRILNFSDSIYASWHQPGGWHYHNVNGVLELGYNKEDIDLRSPQARNPMHPDDWREAYALFNKALREGADYQHHYRAVNADGEPKWYHAEVTVTNKKPDGGALDLVSISRNVTDMRRAAEQAVRNANLEKWLVAKCNAIFNCNNFDSVKKVLQEVGSYLDIDRCTLRVLDPETLCSNLMAEWQKPGLKPLAEVYPEATSHTGESWIGRLIALGQGYVVGDIPREIPSAKLVNYYESIGVQACITQPMIYGDKLTGILSFMHQSPRRWSSTDLRVAKEITEAIHITMLRNRLLDELRATDERFQLAMESSTYGLWDEDKVNGTFYFSPHFYDRLGYPRESGPVPQERLLKYIHPDDHHKLFRQAELEWEEDAIELELRHVKRDGSTVWMLSRGKVVRRDQHGQPLRVVGVNLDITEQKKMLSQLGTARELAEEANRAKSEFLERMSHEIRTPMNAIVGMAYLTQDTALNNEQRSFVQDIDGAAKSLLHIIDDILDFSKIESGELAIVSERFDLREELARLTKLFSVRAAQAGNELSLEIAEDVPALVVGDKNRLGQILMNLLGNAIKFTSQGRIRLQAYLADHDARINSLTLGFAVSDSGIGLSEDQIATLFEPFVQADGSTSRKYGGTGLGLSICKHLVEMMGGSILCSSTPQVGTTFEFTVVCKQNLPETDAVTTAAAEAHPQLSTAANGSFTGKRVLLAEDNPVNQRVARGILGKFAIEVTTANNGEEVLELLADTAPSEFDAVLMDIEMPVLDGLAASRAIRKRTEFQNLPIIAMTAHAMAGDRERCLAAGMDEHIAKPVDPQRLKEVLARFWKHESTATMDRIQS